MILALLASDPPCTLRHLPLWTATRFHATAVGPEEPTDHSSFGVYPPTHVYWMTGAELSCDAPETVRHLLLWRTRIPYA